jgi:hypothetical protein
MVAECRRTVVVDLKIFVGTAAVGCPSPEGRLFWPAPHDPLLDLCVIWALNFPERGKTAADAAGQPKAAVSTKFLEFPHGMDIGPEGISRMN